MFTDKRDIGPGGRARGLELAQRRKITAVLVEEGRDQAIHFVGGHVGETDAVSSGQLYIQEGFG